MWFRPQKWRLDRLSGGVRERRPRCPTAGRVYRCWGRSGMKGRAQQCRRRRTGRGNLRGGWTETTTRGGGRGEAKRRSLRGRPVRTAEDAGRLRPRGEGGAGKDGGADGRRPWGRRCRAGWSRRSGGRGGGNAEGCWGPAPPRRPGSGKPPSRTPWSPETGSPGRGRGHPGYLQRGRGEGVVNKKRRSLRIPSRI